MFKFRLYLVSLLFLTTSLFASNKLAIIVGVNDYDVLTDLEAGVNDAEKMASYYKGLGFKVWLMSDRQDKRLDKPSLQNLERVLDNVSEISEGEKIDELVIFFAGHGVQIEGTNYLCFPETDITKDIGMLSVDQILVPWIRDLGARLSMVYLDACRNDLGPMRAAGVQRGLEVVGIKDKDLGGDLAIFYAAKPGSFSYEKPDGTNGFFTDTLIEALQSNQTNTIADLYSYIRTALPERTEDAYGRPQIPHLGGDFDMTVSFTKGQVDLGAYDTTAKLFVSSSVPGSTIKINGIVRGETPLLVEGLNPGNLLVEVEKNGFYASAQVNLGAKSFERLKLDMKIATGDLVVEKINTLDGSKYKQLAVWVDGRYLGDLNGSLISELKPGAHNIALKGDGFYWEDRVTVEANDAKKINVTLEPVGSLLVYCRPQTIVKLKNRDGGYEIIADKSSERDIELNDLPIGVWEVSVQKEGYITSKENIEILKGKKLSINLELNLSRENEIKKQLTSLKATNIVLNNNYSVSKKSETMGWVSRGIGTGLLGAAGYLVYSAFNSYQSYGDATTEADAVALREESSLFFNVAIGAASGGVLGYVIPMFSNKPKTKKLKPTIESNNIKIIELEAELKEYEE